MDVQGRAVEREREAIRILQPQGRHAGCEVSYDVDEKINYFREWTITADGKQFQARETDFVERGGEMGIVKDIPILLETEKTRIVHPPAADIGATIICESEELLAPWDRKKSGILRAAFRLFLRLLKSTCPLGARTLTHGTDTRP